MFVCQADYLSGATYALLIVYGEGMQLRYHNPHISQHSYVTMSLKMFILPSAYMHSK